MKRYFRLILFSFSAVALSAVCSAGEFSRPVERLRVQRPEHPPSSESVRDSIGRGVNFLLNSQNRNGSWGSAKNTKELNVHAPGTSHDAFRAGTTALCLWALIEVEQASKRNDNPVDLKAAGIDPLVLEGSIDRAEWWTRDHLPKLRRSSEDTLYNVWGHLYSIHSLLKMLERRTTDDTTGIAGRREWIVPLIESQIERLHRYETIYGGWFYYDANQTSPPSETTASFVSAAALIALKEAETAGIEIPEKMIDKTIRSLRRQRNSDFSYLYTEQHRLRPRYAINRPAGSLGRSQSCNLALRLWGDESVTDEVLIDWLDRLCARNGWLDVGRKRPVPHESFFAIAGYFFYYGHFYASLCMENIPESERPVFREFLADMLVGLQEKDGSWWDFPLYDYHRQYGTGFALLSLLRTRGPVSGK